MMGKILFGLVIAIASLVVHAQTYSNYQLAINKGISLSPGFYTQQQEEVGWQLDDNNPNHNVLNYGYANLGSGDIYYVLYSDLQIRSFNLATNQYLGGWELQPYSAMALEPGLRAEYGKYQIDIQYKHFQTHGDLGCLSEHPLRYSDLDNDGSQELILFLSDSHQLDWVVFSTNTNASIFSSRLIHQLSYMGVSATPDELKDLWPNYGKPDDFQYPSRYAGDRVPVMAVGTNSYAKLYFGDFDNDGLFDIVVWRKLYQSRKVSDPVKGFELKEQLWTHYSLDGGSYKKQPTPEATIQSWLTSNTLSWQKGYPSQSECEGEEGQLIKEMHDPLLNDPDVLQ